MEVAGAGVSGTSSTLYDATSTSLAKDDFLKLLVTQLANQDPMSPMEDKEFMGQMAQFSSLEQLTNLGKTLETVSETQSRSATVAEATALIGKQVKIQVPTEETDADGNTVYSSVSGQVEKVKLAGGWPTLVVNGTEYELADVLEVA